MTFINPEEVSKIMPLEQGMKAADLGCGAGFFSVLMAKTVGKEGEVWSVDVQKSALEALQSRAQQEGLENIKTAWADLEIPGATRIPEKSIDFALIVNVLFQSTKKENILNEAKRIMKNGANLMIIEWEPERLDIGPQEGFRISKEAMVKLAENLSFKLKSEFNPGDYHYGLIFTK